MSSINLSNPKVLKNYLLCQAQEGKGKFSVKEKVVIFVNNEGLETIVPDDVAAEIGDNIGIFKPVEIVEPVQVIDVTSDKKEDFYQRVETTSELVEKDKEEIKKRGRPSKK